ncbi:MAG: GNAT family N-acetyltransferase [Candidatus Zixiibacteriota bacterium]
MRNIRIVSDLDECRSIWKQVMPSDFITDLWEVRECFQKNFQRPPYFIVSERNGRITGLLPLSRVDETGNYAYFPGETWAGKTWLEQNRVLVGNDRELRDMLEAIPGEYHLRYLLPTGMTSQSTVIVDEIGYLFRPSAYNYDIESYFGEFSHKTVKRIKKDIAAFFEKDVHFRYDDLRDFDEMVRLNIDRFGEDSYYFDPRFRESFRDLVYFLNEKGWLRMTSIIIDGETAAVDMGALYHGNYTLMAGGTNAAFPGVAKLINTHHMQRACSERMDTVDFLCGNFSWKTMFHLTPRPLYMLSNIPQAVTVPENTVTPIMEKVPLRRSANAG